MKTGPSTLERLRFRNWSITHRLSAWFALSSLALIAAMGFYLDLTLHAQLDDEHAMFLADDVELIRAALSRLDDRAVLAGRQGWPEALTVIASRLHVSILDADRKVLLAASPLDIPLAVLPPPAGLGQRAGPAIVWKSPGGKFYRLVTAAAMIGATGAHEVLLVLALDISLEHRLLTAYRNTLLVTLVAGAIAAATLGYVITRRGLAPVRRIARTANQITSTRLDRRLALADAPVEMRELVAAFNGMLDRLRDSFLRLSQFSSDIAHELRTPINNLMGEAQVALSKSRPAGEYRDALASNVEEYERLSRMIENMLFLARADDPQTKIAPALIDARAEVEKLCEFFRIIADDSDVTLRCAGDGAVFADPLLFRRAVANLISNALRYTPRGGEIVLSIAAEPGGTATATVSNPGAGIAPAHIGRIFDRLYRVEPSREKTGEGAGLGLAIVQSVMDLHRGTVTVQSAPGGQTTFTLHFPAPNP